MIGRSLKLRSIKGVKHISQNKKGVNVHVRRTSIVVATPAGAKT